MPATANSSRNTSAACFPSHPFQECRLAVAWTGVAGMPPAPSQKQNRASLQPPGTAPVWTRCVWFCSSGTALASTAVQHRPPPHPPPLTAGSRHCGPWEPGRGVTCRWVRPEDCGLEGVTWPMLFPLLVAPRGDPAPLFSQQQRRVGYEAGLTGKAASTVSHPISDRDSTSVPKPEAECHHVVSHSPC